MTVPALRLTVLGGDAAAPLLVLGPSLGTSTVLWEAAAEQLAAHYRVVGFDIPGHGSSPAAGAGFTMGELADAVADIVRGEHAETVYYAGVSIGGAIGIELALRHPQLCAAYAIIASGAILGTPEAWFDRAEQVRQQSTSTLVIGSAQRWFAPGSIEREPVVSGRLLHVLQDADDESYALCCEALAGYDARDRLSGIEVPVLVVWGEHDQVAPRESAEQIATGVRRGSTVMVSDAAHLPPAEQPAAVAELLTEFFR